MIDFSKLMQLSFWTSMRPGGLSVKFAIGFALFFALMIVAKVALRIYRARVKDIAKPLRMLLVRFESMLLTMGAFGLVWLFFAFQNVPILASRLFFLIWFIAHFVWLYFILYYAFREMPKELAKIEERKRLEKYLP